MSLQQWQDSGQFFRYKHTHNIFYKRSGTGPVMLLLHGFPTASWDWHKIWEPLAAHYCLITLDFIGFGFSDKPRKYAYSLMDQADLVEALLRDQRIGTYHLLAHDYGDTVAQELLARHYERVERGEEGQPRLISLCLLNGGIFPGTHYPRPIQNALASPLGFLLTPFLSKAKLRRNFKAIFGPDTQASPEEIDDFYELMQRKNGKYLFHRLIRYMKEREVYEDRWGGALCRGALPQRFINGAYDPISGRHVADHYLERVANPDVVILENIGHYPQTEAPDAVVKAFMAFHATHFG